MIRAALARLFGKAPAVPAPAPTAPTPATITPQNVSQSLARILRPEAAYRWLLPSVAAITPQYIEMVLRAALAGDHVRMWELFDLMEDTWPRLKTNLQKVKLAACALVPIYSAYAEEEEEPSDSAKEKMALCSAALRTMRPLPAADENDLHGTLYDILDAWAKGVAVLEVDWELRPLGKLGPCWAPRATRWVHPVCYAWGQDGNLGLRMDAEGRIDGGAIPTTSAQPLPSSVSPFPPGKFLVAIGKSKSGSPLAAALLRPLCWWWCAANFSADWLLNLAQTFGIPFRWANYQPNAPQATVDAICTMLQNMGSAGWAAFPAGTQLELKAEGMKSGKETPQGDMLDRCDKQCDLLILGQTLTTDTGGMGQGGGSKALGQVHQEVQDGLVQAAADFAAGVLETQLFPFLLQLNYAEESECPTMELATEDEEDLTEKAQVIQLLAAAGAAKIIGLDWLGKTFGIPKPGPEEETLESAQPSPPPPGTGNDAPQGPGASPGVSPSNQSQTPQADADLAARVAALATMPEPLLTATLQALAQRS